VLYINVDANKRLYIPLAIAVPN